MMSDSHGNAQMDVPQALESSASRNNAAGRQHMSTAGVPQMEAAAQDQDAGNGFGRPMPGELLMPLLSGEQPALRRLDGRQHAYVQQLTTNAVLNATMTPVFPAGGGPGDQMASRVHASGVLDDSGPQRVPVVQDSFHALQGRRPDRMTVFAYGDHDESPAAPRQGQRRHGESQMISDLADFRAAQAAEAAALSAPGFAFPYNGAGDGRHHDAPADGRQHAPVGFPLQLPEGRRQPEPAVYYSDMRHLSDVQQPAYQDGGGVWQTRQQYSHVAVGAGPAAGHEYIHLQGRDGPQRYGLGRVVQPAFSVDQSVVQQHGYSPPTPLRTPILPSRRDPSEMHLQWLQQQYDAERLSANRETVLDALMQQMQATHNAMHGITTPPKGVSNGGADVSTGSPEYKSNDASVLAVKEGTKASNEMIKALGLQFEEKHKATKLRLDTPPKTAQEILQSLLMCMASAVPDGPHFAALMALAIPLGASRVPASAVQDMRRGVTPPCIAARQQLASMEGPTTMAGSGSKYLATLHKWRLCVSDLLTNDTKYSMLQKTYSKGLRAMCTDTLLGVVGTPTDALDMTVSVLQAMGHTDRENLLEAYQCMGEPMRPPDFALAAQPQELLLWFKIALTVRMDHAQVIGMDPAVLAYLAFLQGLPEGTGDMAHALSKLRANCEGFLSSDAPKDRDVILAFITAEHDSMGTRRQLERVVEEPQASVRVWPWECQCSSCICR